GCGCVPAPFAPGAVLLQTHLPPPRIVGAPVSGANACQAGSHRGGAPTHEPATTSRRRSTRLGCECVPAPFAPGAVLLHMNLPPPRIVGAPASGANMCRTGSHRGGAPTNTPATTPYRRSTRLGCECVLDRFAPGAVLLQMNLPPPRIVGAPAPGANVCLPGSHRGGPAIRRCSYK